MPDTPLLLLSHIIFGTLTVVLLIFPQVVLALEERFAPGESARMRKRRQKYYRMLGVLTGVIFIAGLLPYFVD
ncbi:hypothetical protein ATJ97_2448 [Georgenia soli]|uniref:Uncharacterized protein n=1 Tax=Georgenia soli TaxID=638953 RepID=A0A2A9ELZ4_9MICO|nr:hypothetical protein ATJ97_2448 [Georgenia soli]